MLTRALVLHCAVVLCGGAVQAAVVWPWEMTRLADKSLRIPIFLSPLRAGHYYVQVLVRGDVETIPYASPSEDLDISSPDVCVLACAGDGWRDTCWWR